MTDYNPPSTPKFLKRHGQAFSGAVVGGVTASILTLMLANPAPSNASAAALLAPLGTIANQINSYMSVMEGWVDEWVPSLAGIFDYSAIMQGKDVSKHIQDSVQSALTDSVGYHLEGGGPYRDMLNNSLSLLQEGDGINMSNAASILAPPGMMSGNGVNDDAISQVWNHALLMTGDEPLTPVSPEERDTLAGTEYEYRRVQALQTRLMAQDAIQTYPLAGPRIEGYRTHLQQASTDKIGTLSPGQLAGAQLDMATNVAIPVALDHLESTLRQERLLGTLLAQEVRRTTEELIQDR